MNTTPPREQARPRPARLRPSPGSAPRGAPPRAAALREPRRPPSERAEAGQRDVLPLRGCVRLRPPSPPPPPLSSLPSPSPSSALMAAAIMAAEQEAAKGGGRNRGGVQRVEGKLRASVEKGDYYEAHQMYRTLFFR